MENENIFFPLFLGTGLLYHSPNHKTKHENVEGEGNKSNPHTEILARGLRHLPRGSRFLPHMNEIVMMVMPDQKSKPLMSGMSELELLLLRGSNNSMQRSSNLDEILVHTLHLHRYLPPFQLVSFYWLTYASELHFRDITQVCTSAWTGKTLRSHDTFVSRILFWIPSFVSLLVPRHNMIQCLRDRYCTELARDFLDGSILTSFTFLEEVQAYL